MIDEELDHEPGCLAGLDGRGWSCTCSVGRLCDMARPDRAEPGQWWYCERERAHPGDCLPYKP